MVLVLEYLIQVFLVLQFYNPIYFCPLQYQSICLGRNTFLPISSGSSIFKLLTIDLLLVIMDAPICFLLLHQTVNFFWRVGVWASHNFSINMHHCLIVINSLISGMW